MNVNSLKLEAFDSEKNEEREKTEALCTAKYQEGFEDGINATKDARVRSKKVALEEVAQTLSDLSITLEEAKQAVLASISPVLGSISKIMLPDLARSALTEQLQAIIGEALSQSAAGSFSIALCPDEFEAIAAHLQQDPATLTLSEDPDLSRGQARVKAGICETLIDLTDATCRIQGALGVLVEPVQKVEVNG